MYDMYMLIVGLDKPNKYMLVIPSHCHSLLLARVGNHNHPLLTVSVHTASLPVSLAWAVCELFREELRCSLRTLAAAKDCTWCFVSPWFLSVRVCRLA
jgi:hypothetical protein